MSSITSDSDPAMLDQLRDLADRSSVAQLLDRFVVGLDDHALDDAWLRLIVTDDVLFEFPLGHHDGVAGLAAFLERPMAVFERTHHQCSHPVIDVLGDRATLRANMIATHVHPPDHDGDTGPLAMFGTHLDGRARKVMVIGTHMDGEARKTADGWRLERLTFRLAWILGEPPKSGGPPPAAARV